MRMRILICPTNRLYVKQILMSTGKNRRIDWEAVGKRIRALRGSAKTQREFGKELGVSQGQVARYEQGAEIGAEVLLRIIEKFGKSVQWILTGKE